MATLETEVIRTVFVIYAHIMSSQIENKMRYAIIEIMHDFANWSNNGERFCQLFYIQALSHILNILNLLLRSFYNITCNILNQISTHKKQYILSLLSLRISQSPNDQVK